MKRVTLLLATLFLLTAGWPQATDLRGKVIYFVFLDRFFDGSPDNNFTDDLGASRH